MLEALTDLPEGVIGFEAVGEVTSADYEQTLDPAIDAIDGPVRFVYVLGERFDGYTAGAAWQDAKMGVERCANCTGSRWSPTPTGCATQRSRILCTLNGRGERHDLRTGGRLGRQREFGHLRPVRGGG